MKLDARQRAAARAIAAGMLRKEAAKIAGVSDRQIRRWQERPAFRAEISRLRNIGVEAPPMPAEPEPPRPVSIDELAMRRVRAVLESPTASPREALQAASIAEQLSARRQTRSADEIADEILARGDALPLARRIAREVGLTVAEDEAEMRALLDDIDGDAVGELLASADALECYSLTGRVLRRADASQWRARWRSAIDAMRADAEARAIGVAPPDSARWSDAEESEAH